MKPSTPPSLRNRLAQFRFIKETVFEEDNKWYDENIKDAPHNFDSFTPKLVALTDSVYAIAVVNPSNFVKLLVSSSGIDNLKAESDGELVFSNIDIQRIKNLMRAEYIKKVISVRKASYILELALSPFFRINLSSDWYDKFRTLKADHKLDEAGRKNMIRDQLFTVAAMLMEGWDLFFHENFTWDAPIGLNRKDKVKFIIDHELIPTGSNDPRYKKPVYKPLFTYLNELRASRNALGRVAEGRNAVGGKRITRRKTMRKRK